MVDGRTANEAIVDQAVSWLVQLDAGSADINAFNSWRAADPRHASAFAQVAATWRRTGPALGAAPVAQADPAPQIVQEEPRAWAMPHVSRRAVMGSAAAALLTVGGGAVMWSRPAQAATAVGERRTIRLPDGSRAELNTDSRIEWRFGDRRDFWLVRGEAALTVAPDFDRPFLLRAQTMRAALDSGQYTMRLFAAGERLVTLAGRARISDGAGPERDLMPGHAATITAGALVETRLGQDESARLSAWRQGEIVFDGMTLRAALDEFNRYLPQPIRLADPTIGSLRLGGRFFVDDPAAFLTALRDGFGITGTRTGDGVELRGGAAPALSPVQQKNIPTR